PTPNVVQRTIFYGFSISLAVFLTKHEGERLKENIYCGLTETAVPKFVREIAKRPSPEGIFKQCSRWNLAHVLPPNDKESILSAPPRWTWRVCLDFRAEHSG